MSEHKSNKPKVQMTNSVSNEQNKKVIDKVRIELYYSRIAKSKKRK